MAQQWGGRYAITGDGKLTNPLDLTTPNDPLNIGSNNFDAISQTIASSAGVGSGAANEQWHDERTLTTTSTDSLDLSGAALTNGLGVAVVFTKIKLFLLAIDAPDGTKKLRVGPNATANAWQGWFGATTANLFEDVFDVTFHVDFYTGWTVTAGTGDLLIINNPSAGSVTYRLWLVGTK